MTGDTVFVMLDDKGKFIAVYADYDDIPNRYLPRLSQTFQIQEETLR